MNCTEVKELLSAYHDGELVSDVHDAVALHLEGCPDCAAALASFRQLSELSGQFAHPEPPDQWAAIEVRLATATVTQRIANTWTKTFSRIAPLGDGLRRFVPSSPLAVAATVLLVVGAGVGSYYAWFSAASRNQQLAATFDAYLGQFEENPQAAQQVLLASYDGQKVDFPTATRLVGYEPAAEHRLPADYVVEAVYVLDMPCCKCTQTICRRKGNGQIAIFEHNTDEPVWFADRPAIEARCCGKPTRIVELDSGLLAATWPSNKRHLTVIGARDVEEVAQMVAHFERTGEYLQ